MNRDNDVKVMVWIDKDLLEAFDKSIAKRNYKSRSEWLREKIRLEANKK